jgi:DNA-binding response OmpR family regulator
MNATTNTSKSSDSYGAPRRARRVIVVEDEKDSLNTLLDLLKSEGHDVRGVSSAKELWATMRVFEPEVCLIDIGLPDRSGYDIAQEMVRRFGDDRPKMIAVTAWIQSSDRILATLAGFDHHVAKPYDPNALLALVSDLAGDPGR